MNIFFILLIFLTFLSHGKFLSAENCSRFCVIHLSTAYYRFNNNLLDLNLQYCSHLILDAYEDNDELNYDMLLKAFKSIQNSRKFFENLKVLTLLKYDELTIDNENIKNPLLNKLKNFDGFYFNWTEEKYITEEFYKMETIKQKQKLLSKILQNFRRIFKNKIIVTTVGPKYASHGYYDFKVFNETVDFIVLDSEQYLMHRHEQNWFPSKQRFENNATMESLANILINNGIPKYKLLIYVEGPKYVVEPRIRIIWASLNSFSGYLIDHMEKFNNHLFKPNEMNVDITKLEKLYICPSDENNNIPKKGSLQNLICYYSLNNEKSYQKITKENYQKCDKIIFHKLNSNYSENIFAENLHKTIQYFHDLKLPITSLILSLVINYNETTKIWKEIDSFEKFCDMTASNIIDLVRHFDLDGIELICDDYLTAENLHKIVTSIRSTVSKDIEIGLQVNVFNVGEELVEVINNNNISWVTHKINPLSDASLAIFYQWAKLNEKYELDLKKVVIKFSPSIWQQNAIFSFPGKRDTKEEEDPEDDLLLNRKYLCLNETIKQNLPDPNAFINLPIIFSIPEDVEKSKEKMLQRLDDPQLLLAVISFNGKPLPHDKYYLRYETKEIMKYKIKVAEKYGFGGGFAIAAINDDDFEEICDGNSMFDELINILK